MTSPYGRMTQAEYERWVRWCQERLRIERARDTAGHWTVTLTDTGTGHRRTAHGDRDMSRVVVEQGLARQLWWTRHDATDTI